MCLTGIISGDSPFCWALHSGVHCATKFGPSHIIHSYSKCRNDSGSFENSISVSKSSAKNPKFIRI